MPETKNIFIRLALWLLRKFVRSEDFSFAYGDFAEMYNNETGRNGDRKAGRFLWREVIRSLPGFLRNALHWRLSMFKNYIKISLRNMSRRKLFTVINVLGLAVGMACFILISFFVRDEHSFDRFHTNKDRLYLMTITHINGVLDRNVPYALTPLLADENPEIEDFTRIYEYGNRVMCSFKYSPPEGSPVMDYEENVTFVDSGFISMFSFPFIYGSPETALSSRDNLVITENIARKYFGDKNPLGETLRLNGRADMTVSGVIRVPANSHLQPDFMAVLPNRMDDNWNWADPSYILLKTGVSLPDFRDKIAGSLNAKFPGNLGGKLTVDILPMEKVHLQFGRQIYVTIFSLIAYFILLIACFNYMNLSTASSSIRARDVGLRKVIGAKNGQLIQQFLGESVFLSAIAVLLSLVLVKLFLPVLNTLTAKELSFSLLQSPAMIFLLLGLVLSVGIFAGLYPALFLTKAKPADILRKESGRRSRRATFRVVSVVGQFTISILLIACTGVVFKQLRFIQKQGIGITTDNVIQVPINRILVNRLDGYKNAILEHPNVINMTAGQAVPYNEDYKSGADWEGKDPDMMSMFRYSVATFDYLETFGMEIVAGRSFDSRNKGDEQNFIINQKAAEYMGMENPVGKRLTFWNRSGTIIGVVKNYHHVSLHREIMPQIYTVNPQNFGALRHIFIKIAPENIQETIGHIRETTQSFSPDFPFSYRFIDEGIEALYQNERRLSRIFSAFAFLAVFISCLGIFGLASHTAERKTKEIGIRKILGSSPAGIVKLLTGKISVWILLANTIALPVGWYL
ncbi:MAG: ABC transporter permease, partial [Candidatus Aminicenantes bacterium]|nr:ABC transporter permease [Candidatus Aminicenantes bacterium]